MILTLIHPERRIHVLRILALLAALFSLLALASAQTPLPHSQKTTAAASALSSADPIFLAPELYRIGGYADPSIAIADLNLDGNPDLIAAPHYSYGSSSAVSVLLGNADGTFQPAVTYDAGGFEASSLAIGDVDGDTRLDIVVANRCALHYECTYNPVQVLLGNGDGTFRTGVTYDATYEWSPSIALGDFNADGKLDLALGCGDHCVSIALGNGDGTFHPALDIDAGSNGPNSVTVADLNRDGKLDLVLGCSGGCVAIVLGNGDGTFQPARTYFSGGNGLNSVAVADLNADGKPDLAVANACSVSGFDCTNVTPGELDVYLGNGDGTFQPAIEYDSGGVLTHSIAIADVNHDSKPDLMLTNPWGGGGSATNPTTTVSVFLAAGGGKFQPAIIYSTGTESNYALAVADFNHDNRPDLAVTDRGGIEIMLNNVHPHDATTTTLLSSSNPSHFGQEITLSAIVSSPAGTPTGIVTFYEGETELSNVSLEAGSAVFSIYWLTPGSHSIAAKYQGSMQFSVSVSPTLTQVVGTAPTTTTLTSWQNPSGPDQPFKLVMGASNGSPLPPTGSITLKDGATTITTLALRNGGASLKTVFPNGIHALTAAYSGDANNAPSISPLLKQYIGWFPVVTTTTVTSSRLHSLPGQPITFTAQVAPANPAYGQVDDGELVTFFDGATRLASVALSHGIATFTTSLASAKIHYVKASYAGDSIFKPSTGTLQQAVDKYPTVTTRWSSANPSRLGQAVTLSAHVASTGPAVPTGTVIFKDGTTRIGSATLSGGTARITKSSLTAGTHPITVYYMGDTASGASTSKVLNQVVR